MSRKRVGKKDKYMRKVQIERLLVKGYWESEIVDNLSREWSCSRANVYNYIAEIKSEWRNVEKADPNELRQKFLIRLEMLFQLALEAGSIKVGLEIQNQINRLTGMYEQETQDTDAVEVITISERSNTTRMLKPAQSDSDES